LRGDKPADLPVQAPTKFENRRPSQDSEGARRYRLALLLAADEVIE